MQTEGRQASSRQRHEDRKKGTLGGTDGESTGREVAWKQTASTSLTGTQDSAGNGQWGLNI